MEESKRETREPFGLILLLFLLLYFTTTAIDVSMHACMRLREVLSENKLIEFRDSRETRRMKRKVRQKWIINSALYSITINKNLFSFCFTFFVLFWEWANATRRNKQSVMHCINFIYSFILFSIELRIFFFRWFRDEAGGRNNESNKFNL